jgi:hypothetical protein
MFQYRQVLVRLRAGDTVREIARSGLMGRDKLGELHAVAQSQGWLDSGSESPTTRPLPRRWGRPGAPAPPSPAPSRTARPSRPGCEAGVQGRAIHAALKREHAFTGSYSAVVRMLRQSRDEQPPRSPCA